MNSQKTTMSKLGEKNKGESILPQCPYQQTRGRRRKVCNTTRITVSPEHPQLMSRFLPIPYSSLSLPPHTSTTPMFQRVRTATRT